MTDEQIENCTVGQKTTFGQIKKYLLEEIKKEIIAENHPGVKIHGEYLARDDKFYEEQIKKQKHEKIEKMAWGLFIKNGAKLHVTFKKCWEEAERIYNFLKKKQEEGNDTNNTEN